MSLNSFDVQVVSSVGTEVGLDWEKVISRILLYTVKLSKKLNIVIFFFPYEYIVD